MPKLWNETIETHRDAVRQAVLDAAANLVEGHGLSGVTMSAIAQSAGIGRATLYKYFPDVESILMAWHERQIESHLAELALVRDRTEGAWQQLEAVLHAYAFLSRHGHSDAEAVRLHQGRHTGDARASLQAFIAELVRRGAADGAFRQDVAPDELAVFCLHALGAAAGLSSPESMLRLVSVTLDGLRPAQPSRT